MPKGDAEKEEKKVKRKEAPIYETTKMLAEIIKWETQTRWLLYYKDNGKMETIDYLGSEEEPIYPAYDEGVVMGAVLLPSYPKDYGSVENLLQEIQAHIHKYLDVSKEFEEIASYYVLLSWVYDKVNTLPYLRFMGDTGTGKSRGLDVVGRLCYRACMVSGAITPAPIYRMIRKWEGTLVLDEADFSNSDTKHEVIKILNCGFERSRPVLRCVQDNPENLQFLPTFSPKVIATRFEFADKALEARCITEILKETTRKDIPEVLGKIFYENESELRNKMLKFRLDYRDRLDVEVSGVFNTEGIEPRIRQMLSAFAVFSNIENLREKIEDFARKKQQAIIESRAETLEGEIVSAIVELEEQEVVSSTDIADYINSNRSEKDKVSARRIGHILKSLGFKTTQKRVKVDDKWTVRRNIERDGSLISKLKARYVPDVSFVSNVSIIRETGQKTLQNSTEPPIIKKLKSPVTIDTIDTTIQKSTLQERIKNIPNNELHIEILKNHFKLTTDEIEKLKRVGLLEEISPGMFIKIH